VLATWRAVLVWWKPSASATTGAGACNTSCRSAETRASLSGIPSLRSRQVLPGVLAGKQPARFSGPGRGGELAQQAGERLGNGHRRGRRTG